MWPAERTLSPSSSSSVSFASVSRSPYQETTHRVVMNENSNRFTLNSLWSCWYGVLTVILQVYIIGKSVTRFTGDHGYLSLSWPKNSTPYTELNAYVVLIGAGVILVPFFAVSAIMKIGNSPNDGNKIGERRTATSRDRANHSLRNISYNSKFQGDSLQPAECIYANATSSTDATHKSQSLLMKLWQHMLPIAALVHVLSALAFLLPRVLMESQLIAHAFLPKSDLWKTEMDCFLDFIQDGRVELLDFLQPINETEKAWLKQTLAQNSHLSASSLISRTQIVSSGTSDATATATTASVGSVIIQTTRSSIAQKLDLMPGSMSLEFINLVIALLVIVVRYPCIFWRTNKPFALLMSFQIFITCIVALVTYSSFSILYKVHIMTPDRALLRYPNAFTLTTEQTVFLTLAFILILILSTSTLCMYGCSKYNQWKRKQLSKSYITHESCTAANCCWGFAPHLLAFLCLMVKAVAAIPLMYDFIVVYCGSLDSASLVGAFAIAFYLLEYIVLWLFLTVKHSWTFNLPSSSSSSSSSHANEPSSRGHRAPALLPGQKASPSHLIVIDQGKTYQINESACRAAIRSLACNSSSGDASDQGKSSPAHDPVNSSDATQQFWLQDEQETSPTHERQQSVTRDNSNGTIPSDEAVDSCPDDLEGGKNTRAFSWLRSASRRRSMSSSTDASKLARNKKHSSLKDASATSEIESFLNEPSEQSRLQSVPENREKRVFLPSGDGMMGQQGSVNHHRYPSLNGDYELLVDSNNQNQSTTGDQSTDYDIYGVCRLFSQAPVSTLNRNSGRFTSSNYPAIRVSSYNQQEAMMANMQSNVHHTLDRFTRVGSISSESSTSPEKLSETSSGIHSACPSITSEKRCSSAENLSTITSTFANVPSNYTGTAYIHSRPSFRMSSLQRGPIQVRCPKVTRSVPPVAPFSPAIVDAPLPPPMAELETVAFRRQMKEQANQSSQVSRRHASLASDASDLDSLMSQPLPPPPPETLTSVALLTSNATVNSCNYSHSSSQVKPVESIVPQPPKHTAPGGKSCYTFASQPAVGPFTCPPVVNTLKDASITQAHLPSEFELALQKHFL